MSVCQVAREEEEHAQKGIVFFGAFKTEVEIPVCEN